MKHVLLNMKLYRLGTHDKQLSFLEKKENETIYTKKKDLMDIKCKSIVTIQKMEEVVLTIYMNIYMLQNKITIYVILFQ